MDRIGSGVRIDASFQVFALIMLLHSAGFTSGGFFVKVIIGGKYLQGVTSGYHRFIDEDFRWSL